MKKMAMWKRISVFLTRVSNGWVALTALVIFGLFIGLVLPLQSAQARAGMPGAGSPDMSLLYSADDLYRMAQTYGEPGRAFYIRARFTFDLIWPLVYVFFLGTATSWVNRKAFAENSPWHLTNLAPLVSGLFDYLENLCASLVMFRYPAHTAVLDIIAPLFTLAKWVMLGVSFLLLIAGIVLAIFRSCSTTH